MSLSLLICLSDDLLQYLSGPIYRQGHLKEIPGLMFSGFLSGIQNNWDWFITSNQDRMRRARTWVQEVQGSLGKAQAVLVPCDTWIRSALCLVPEAADRVP